MNKELIGVINKNYIAKETVELVLYSEEIAKTAIPGQFLHIQLPNHTLRRPISIASVDLEGHTVTILFKITGSGTQLLASYEHGMQLDVIGPAGSGFPIDDLKQDEPVLLIGGGIGVPPIHFLLEHLNARGIETKTILGFQTEAYVFYEELFRNKGQTTIVTDDGSYQNKGFVTDYIEAAGSFQRYYACGPMPMLKALKSTMTEKEGYLSFEERMGCGVGTCLACVIPTNDEAGYKKICQDGPVFAANEVIL